MKKWNKEDITTLIQTNDKMVIKSLIELFKKQTSDEQKVEHTKYDNNQGFNHADAKRLTNIAKWAIKTGFLTPGQTALVRRRILKYAGQLTRIANEKIKETVKPSLPILVNIYFKKLS